MYELKRLILSRCQSSKTQIDPTLSGNHPIGKLQNEWIVTKISSVTPTGAPENKVHSNRLGHHLVGSLLCNVK